MSEAAMWARQGRALDMAEGAPKKRYESQSGDRCPRHG
jgi:hypothetical protein